MPLRRTKPPPAAREVPLLPLRGMLVFPRMMMHLEVGREKSILAVSDAMGRDRHILLATQKQVDVEQPEPEDIHETGTLAEIKQLVRLPEGNLRVLVEGVSRARILSFVRTDPSHRVRVEELPLSQKDNAAEVEALVRTVTGLFEQYVKQSRKLGSDALSSLQGLTEPGAIADQIISLLTLKVEEKQALLDAADITERLLRLAEVLQREIEIVELERKISHRVRKQMEKSQREYYLREQLKAIHKELGDGTEDRASEAAELRERIKKADFPPAVAEKAEKEVARLEKMPPTAAESVVVRTYLDWLLALPFTKCTEDHLDLDHAKRVLDEDHFGLEKVKERILEFLAIRQLSTDLRGPILCLVGPPGVGKTSLGKSVARAMERKFVRISLGGVRDEAEIRGHRRTYVGALPGRIIQGMRQSENALRQVIRLYTRESGVRQMERQLAAVCRKVAREVVGGRHKKVRVTVANLRTYLGVPRYHATKAEKRDEVGVAQGLGVTDYGGQLMAVEVTVLKGKGEVMLTGKLGEVMRESAQAGLSYIRSRSERFGVEPDFHERYDLHVHIPEGALPKDGPSAGIAMATAVASALARIPVRHDVAMTGEITLRGKVLGIGGLKEKVLAAHRVGVKTVVLPRDNEKDLEDIPAEIRREMRLVMAGHMDEVLEVALVGGLPPATSRPPSLAADGQAVQQPTQQIV